MGLCVCVPVSVCVVVTSQSSPQLASSEPAAFLLSPAHTGTLAIHAFKHTPPPRAPYQLWNVSDEGITLMGGEVEDGTMQSFAQKQLGGGYTCTPICSKKARRDRLSPMAPVPPGVTVPPLTNAPRIPLNLGRLGGGQRWPNVCIITVFILISHARLIVVTYFLF